MIQDQDYKPTPLQHTLRKLDDVPAQTPLTVIKGVTVRRTQKGLTVLRLHYSAIPERDPATPKGKIWFERERSVYASEARWRKEQEIDANATGGEAVFGTVLSQFYETVIISDPYWTPEELGPSDVIGSFDHGVTNATCLLKGYVPRRRIDRVSGRALPPELYVAGEFYSYRREGWDNTVEQNTAVIMRGGYDLASNLVPQLEKPVEPMPDLDRARWIMADPSIFPDTVVQEKGKPTAIYRTYHKNGFYPMRAYGGNRSDVAFVEWILSDFWRGIANGMKPRLYIVCRNPSDRPQPGLHPYDCPNLVWEMRRAKRVQLTARQLLTRNPSESLQDKNNHALDCLKEMTGTLRNPTDVPFEEELQEKLEQVTDPTTKVLRTRYLMTEAMLQGKIGPDGKVRHGKTAVTVDLRRSPSIGSRRGY